ncbi:amidase [Oceaniglobus ichthyenteri]|uniref:amidase n=1 Tax=Oceaniglobus ichthyenteri TaxID=2136177 RepID=UPI000D33F3F4|nr:amidase family protein [Oceaniglobus ichthyenteri]
MTNWLTITAGDLGRGIGAGDIDPVELCQTYLDAIETHEFRDRIYARLTVDRALTEAAAARDRAKAGRRLSLLDGVPISWKDLFDSAGVATESGSALLRGRTPDHDAVVLANATAAGLVCLGKTHMTELAFSGLGLNPVTASPPCVNDHAAVSGGSSSGAATSVAFGLAAAGIGSDTGGSVRAPAAWNDLVGLKTTLGRVSVGGVVPLCPRFDTIGPLCRSVEDAALLLAALEGGTAPDLANASLQDTRFLVLETCAFDDIDPKVDAAFNSAVDRLKAAGARITRAEISHVTDAMDQSASVFAPEAYGVWGDTIEANPDAMHDQVRERFRGGKAISAPAYVKAWRVIDQARAEYAAATAGYDAVLLPTCAILPPNKERLETDGDYFVKSNLMTLRNTRIGNLLNLAALTLPTGVSSVGITLQTNPMSEHRLLRLGAAAERALA